MAHPFLLQQEKPDTTTTITTMEDKKLPLLFLLGELSKETKHAFFDPVQEKLSIVELPELGCQTECISSGHGWLLLLSRDTSSIFFFNPLTRQRIDLPYLNSIINAAVFSAPPTSPNCIVFAIKRSYDKFHIDALCLGQERVWTRYAYNNIGTSKFGIIVQALFSNNILYLLDSRGRVGNFNFTNNWKIISNKIIKICISYLVECNGEVFGLERQNYGGVVDRVLKLKFEDGVSSWEVLKDSGDITMFFGPYGSCAFTGLNDKLKKKIFVARDDPRSKCVIYNVDDGCDYKKKKTLMFDATPFSWWYAPVWIERPASS